MTLFRRRKSSKDDDSGGVIVAAPGHRCEPPGCHEWPAGEWKIDQPKKYPEGTVWRCPCGKAWRSGRYGSGFREGNGLWLNWWRSREDDAGGDDG